METAKRRGPRKTAAQWAEVLAAYRDSGATQDAFARSRGVSVAALRNHLYRRSPGKRIAGSVRGFVPVRLRGESEDAKAGIAAGARPTLVVRWPQGASVELHIEPTGPGVAELIRSLIEPCLR